MTTRGKPRSFLFFLAISEYKLDCEWEIFFWPKVNERIWWSIYSWVISTLQSWPHYLKYLLSGSIYNSSHILIFFCHFYINSFMHGHTHCDSHVYIYILSLISHPHSCFIHLLLPCASATKGPPIILFKIPLLSEVFLLPSTHFWYSLILIYKSF